MYNIRLGYGCGIKATLLTASGEVCDLRRARYKGALLVLPNGSTMPCADVSVDDITNAMYVRLLGDRELTNIGKYGIVFNVKLANGVMYSSPVVMFGEVLDNAEMEYKELNISIAVTVTYLPSNVAYTGASPKISPNGTWLVYNDDINAYEDTGEPANYAGITADIQELQASFNMQNITGLVAVDWKTVGKNDSGEICVIGGDTEVADYLAGYLKHNDYVQRSVLNEYATHEWVESKGYITEKDIPLNIGAFVNDKGYITLDAIAPYAKKGTTLGDYGIENAYTKSECEAAFFAATKIDNVTIKRDEGGFLYVASGGGGNAGIDEAQLADYLARNLYTTEGWVYSQLDKYALKSAIPTDYLTQSGEQDVYAVKNFIQGLKIGGLPIYKSQDKTIYIDGNLVVRGGITALGTNETISPSIFEALPIDGATLKRTEKGVLYVDTNVVGGGGSGGGSVDPSQLEAYLKPYAKTADVASTYATIASLSAVTSRLNDFLAGSDTDAIINKWSELETFLAGLTETDNLATILSGKANKATTLAGYGITDAYTKSHIDSNFVTIGTKQRITGEKDFVGGFKINGGLVEYNATLKAWVFNGDLLVTGGMAAFSNISGFKPSTITDAVLIDDRTIKRNADGLLYAVAQGAGGINEDQLEEYLRPYATQSWVTGIGYITSSALNAYLPKTGGQVEGDLTIKGSRLQPLYIQSGQSSAGIIFFTATENATLMYSGGSNWRVTDNWWKQAYYLLHSGNYSEYITKSYVKNTLGISDWALASAKPSYSYSEISGTPTSLKNPNTLSWSGYSSGSYDGSTAQSIALPTKLSQLTDDVVSGKYLPLTGGTISGNLAIGGATTLDKLHVYGAISSENTNADAGFRARGSTYALFFGIGSGNVNRGIYDDYHKEWWIMRGADKTTTIGGSMVASGLRINQSAFNNGLTLNRTSANAGAGIVFRSNDSLLGQIGINGTKTFEVSDGATIKASIEITTGNLLVTGGITATNSSDRRLKKNIRKFNASKVLMSLGGVYEYEYIDSEVQKNHIYEGLHYGLIYQHVKGTALDVMCHEREDGFGTLNYIHPKFISLIAGATMENISEVEKLKRKIRHLENKVKQLEQRA